MVSRAWDAALGLCVMTAWLSRVSGCGAFAWWTNTNTAVSHGVFVFPAVFEVFIILLLLLIITVTPCYGRLRDFDP